MALYHDGVCKKNDRNFDEVLKNDLNLRQLLLENTHELDMEGATITNVKGQKY